MAHRNYNRTLRPRIGYLFANSAETLTGIPGQNFCGYSAEANEQYRLAKQKSFFYNSGPPKLPRLLLVYDPKENLWCPED